MVQKILLIALCFLLPAAAGAAVAQSGPNLSYIVDDAGRRIGASIMTADGGALSGEVFVDSRGNVGLIDCERRHIAFELAEVHPAQENCRREKVAWDDLYRELLATKGKIEFPDQRLGYLQVPVRLGIPAGCDRPSCASVETGVPCIVCGVLTARGYAPPVQSDPDDVWSCLMQGECRSLKRMVAKAAGKGSDKPPVESDPDGPWWCLTTRLCRSAHVADLIVLVPDFSAGRVVPGTEIVQDPELLFVLDGTFVQAKPGPEGTIGYVSPVGLPLTPEPSGSFGEDTRR
jgi:hypothetical protein